MTEFLVKFTVPSRIYRGSHPNDNLSGVEVNSHVEVVLFQALHRTAHSRQTPGVSIHFKMPLGRGPRRSQSIRTSAAFFMSTSKAGQSRRNATIVLIKGS